MRRMVIAGFLIWAAATAALRVGGEHLFFSRSAASILALLLGSLPLMVLVASLMLRRYPSEQRPLAAIALVAPGMTLDTFSAIWFPSVFPNIRPDAAGLFGGWLLFCNVVVLLTAVVAGLSSSSASVAGRD